MFVKNQKYNLPDKDGFFGEFGGMFVPENFKPVLRRLDDEFEKAIADENFLKEVYDLLNAHVKLGIAIHPAGEWILDNQRIPVYCQCKRIKVSKPQTVPNSILLTNP